MAKSRGDPTGNDARRGAAVNVFEFSEEFKISLAKARAIKKRFPHIFDGEDSRFDPLRSTLAKGNRLTAQQLVGLIEAPGNLLELGKHAGTAERQLAALGDAKGQVAPVEVVANILEAAKGEPEAVEIMVNWLKSVIPDKPVEHAYLAVRLLLGVRENIRRFEAPRIPRALLNARNHPGLAGWWRTEKTKTSQTRTFYQKNPFDL